MAHKWVMLSASVQMSVVTASEVVGRPEDSSTFWHRRLQSSLCRVWYLSEWHQHILQNVLHKQWKQRSAVV